MRKLQEQYFGISTTEPAEHLATNGWGVFWPNYSEALADVAAGDEIRAAKRIVDLSGCSIADARLSVDLIRLHNKSA